MLRIKSKIALIHSLQQGNIISFMQAVANVASLTNDWKQSLSTEHEPSLLYLLVDNNEPEFITTLLNAVTQNDNLPPLLQQELLRIFHGRTLLEMAVIRQKYEAIHALLTYQPSNLSQHHPWSDYTAVSEKIREAFENQSLKRRTVLIDSVGANNFQITGLLLTSSPQPTEKEQRELLRICCAKGYVPMFEMLHEAFFYNSDKKLDDDSLLELFNTAFAKNQMDILSKLLELYWQGFINTMVKTYTQKGKDGLGQIIVAVLNSNNFEAFKAIIDKCDPTTCKLALDFYKLQHISPEKFILAIKGLYIRKAVQLNKQNLISAFCNNYPHFIEDNQKLKQPVAVTLLLDACEAGNVESIRRFLRDKLNEQFYAQQSSVLHITSMHEHYDASHFLVEQGIDLTLTDSKGYTAIARVNQKIQFFTKIREELAKLPEAEKKAKSQTFQENEEHIQRLTQIKRYLENQATLRQLQQDNQRLQREVELLKSPPNALDKDRSESAKPQAAPSKVVPDTTQGRSFIETQSSAAPRKRPADNSGATIAAEKPPRLG